MVVCDRCKKNIESLFSKDECNYYHCDNCHTNLKENCGNITEIKKIVSSVNGNKTSNITPGYLPLKRTQRSAGNMNQNDERNDCVSKYECVFCRDMKINNVLQTEYLYCKLFLDDSEM